MILQAGCALRRQRPRDRGAGDPGHQAPHCGGLRTGSPPTAPTSASRYGETAGGGGLLGDERRERRAALQPACAERLQAHADWTRIDGRQGAAGAGRICQPRGYLRRRGRGGRAAGTPPVLPRESALRVRFTITRQTAPAPGNTPSPAGSGPRASRPGAGRRWTISADKVKLSPRRTAVLRLSAAPGALPVGRRRGDAGRGELRDPPRRRGRSPSTAGWKRWSSRWTRRSTPFTSRPATAGRWISSSPKRSTSGSGSRSCCSCGAEARSSSTGCCRRPLASTATTPSSSCCCAELEEYYPADARGEAEAPPAGRTAEAPAVSAPEPGGLRSTACGVFNLSLGLGADQKGPAFSEEIMHGLGQGPVYVDVGRRVHRRGLRAGRPAARSCSGTRLPLQIGRARGRRRSGSTTSPPPSRFFRSAAPSSWRLQPREADRAHQPADPLVRLPARGALQAAQAAATAGERMLTAQSRYDRAGAEGRRPPLPRLREHAQRGLHLPGDGSRGRHAWTRTASTPLPPGRAPTRSGWRRSATPTIYTHAFMIVSTEEKGRIAAVAAVLKGGQADRVGITRACELEPVRTVLKNEVNEIAVCVDLGRRHGRVLHHDLDHRAARPAGGGRAAGAGPLLRRRRLPRLRYSQGDRLNLVFLYRDENLLERQGPFYATELRPPQTDRAKPRGRAGGVAGDRVRRAAAALAAQPQHRPRSDGLPQLLPRLPEVGPGHGGQPVLPVCRAGGLPDPLPGI